MEKTRPILYGVSDYAEMRRRNGWFIDRTAKIRDLEATHYAVFLRPRRAPPPRLRVPRWGMRVGRGSVTVKIDSGTVLGKLCVKGQRRCLYE